MCTFTKASPTSRVTADAGQFLLRVMLLRFFSHINLVFMAEVILSFRNTIRVSSSFDPDQARHFVGPGLGPNCLEKQKLPLAEKAFKSYEEILQINFI